jgi:hypothetical protein
MRTSLLFFILLAVGCTADTGPEEVARAEGESLFAANCAACHGPNGQGDGLAVAGLSTQSADLTLIAERRDGVWPMLEVMSIIDGYTKSTTPREDMPVITSLTEGPELEFDTGNGQVVTAPARLVALTRFIESIQMPPPVSYVP